MFQATSTVQAAAAATRLPGGVVAANLPLLLDGLRTTAQLAALALVIAVTLGLCAGIARVVPVRPLRAIGTAYVEFFRNTPLLLQMFFAYFGLGAIGIKLPGFVAAFLALGVYTGAFMGEVFRAGILSVARGQVEAARSLGLSYGQTMRLVVLPQAVATTVPPFGSLVIAMTKNTSLAYSISVPDLLFNGYLVNSRTFATFEVFAAIALGYLALTIPMSVAVNALERRLTRYRR
jgi:aspartate/glutamate/glutamine transport system permease protein